MVELYVSSVQVPNNATNAAHAENMRQILVDALLLGLSAGLI